MKEIPHTSLPMEDKLFDWCSNHWPVLTGFIAALIVCIWLTIKAVNAYHYWKRKIMDNSKHSDRIEKEIFPMLATINDNIKGLTIYLRTKDREFDPQIFMSRSPIRLTELGWRILETIGGKTYVDENKDALIARMNEIGIKTALDSQQIAPVVISEFASEDSFASIKNYMFNNPFYKENIGTENEISVEMDMENVTNILGIYLRDVYLETRHDLDADDIP